MQTTNCQERDDNGYNNFIRNIYDYKLYLRETYNSAAYPADFALSKYTIMTRHIKKHIQSNHLIYQRYIDGYIAWNVDKLIDMAKDLCMYYGIKPESHINNNEEKEKTQ